MTITLPMIAWALGIMGAWTGILLGAIKYLLNRQIAAFEAKVAEADAKAGKALSALSEHKQIVTSSIADLRLEFDRKSVCSNHQRMEKNDGKLFERLDNLHGDIRELVGGVKGLTNSLELVNQHLLSGGK
jgi:hypothetical protein